MLRSALGVAISIFAFALAGSISQAQAASATKSSAKKQSISKPVAKRRQVATRTAKGRVKVKLSRTSSHSAANGKHKDGYRRVKFAPNVSVAPPVMTAGDMAGLSATRDPLALRSNAAFVIDQGNAQVLFEKNAQVALPIASLTKLMTAVVVVEARQNMDEVLEVTSDDIDREKNSSSRLRVGARMTRANMLHIALMSSENRAASALGRNYPGGLPAFVAAMNAKARALGMNDAHYVDSTGLSSHNVASARDLAKLVVAAYKYPVIRAYSTDARYAVDAGRYQLQYMNSNRLVMNPGWEIGLQKTGYITEAGRCLVMQARIDGRAVVMVFLDSKGKDSRLADAGRVRKWLEVTKPQALTQTLARQG
jgi:D-alanyl-D-alanine endopeptidase (penicillin-binding protein 7)